MADSSSYPTCSDLSDVKPLWKRNGLYLKPLVKVKISVQLPVSKSTDYAISNHALMEAVRELARPDVFCSIKTTKTTVDVVKFEAELEKPSSLRWVISRIDGETVKLRGHKDTAKIRACSAKNDFPTRHDWDSFFRDNKHMNELKAGERPDTIHIQDIPVEWFVTERSNGRPNEKFICRVFEQFGAISAVDIPSNDPYRSQMKDHISGMKQFNFSSTNLFETYIQFKDYLSFVAAMDALRGMKLLKKDDDQARTQVIKVDFDRSKHLSEGSIRKRKVLREKLMEKERQKEEQCEKVVDNVVRTKLARSESSGEEPVRTERSEEDEEEELSSRKILREENLLTAAQRKLESIRLLSELLERVADKRRINEGSRMDRRAKQKSIVALPNQGSYANRAYLDNGGAASSNDASSSNDAYFQHRGQNWRGRGQPFYNQRGRFMRNRGTYTTMGQNSWGHYNSQSDGYHRNGINNRGGYAFNNQKGGNRGGLNNFRNYQDLNNFGRNFLDDRRNPDYGGHLDPRYIRYFLSLAKGGNKDDRERYSRSRSRSRRRSRSRSRYRTHSRSRRRSRTRSRSRSHRRHSRSRTRSRSRSRRRTKSRSRSRSRQRSRSRSRSHSHRRSRSDEKSKSRDRSQSRRRSKSQELPDSSGRSKDHGRSKSRGRSKSPNRSKSDRRTKSRSRSKSRKKAKSRSRSQSWTDVRSRSRSRSWSQTKTKASSSASKNRDHSTSSK